MDLKTVCECNRQLGCKTLHPQASIINLKHSGVRQDAVKFEFYAILLIENCEDGCGDCGRKYYDYSTASMVFLTPGEIFQMNANNTLPDKGWLLAFHPDLLLYTSLFNHIGNYTFFNYRKEEALHLSQRETSIVGCCFQNIEEELRHPIDSHTGTILSRHIELLLDYCSRFYERQFITRENRNNAILAKLDQLFNAYITEGKLQTGTIPTTEFCAGKLNLSTAYLSDLLKFETGKSLSEHFNFKRLSIAKKMLQKNYAPQSVARLLGFQNMQQFNLIFKKITGILPSEYKYAHN